MGAFRQPLGNFVAGSTNEKQRERNKNVHFHPPQKQRTAAKSSQGGGATTAIIPPCRDLCQDFVRRRRPPRTLHDRTEDGEEGVTAWQWSRWRSRWQSRWRSRCRRSIRENSYFD